MWDQIIKCVEKSTFYNVLLTIPIINVYMDTIRILQSFWWFLSLLELLIMMEQVSRCLKKFDGALKEVGRRLCKLCTLTASFLLICICLVNVIMICIFLFFLYLVSLYFDILLYCSLQTWSIINTFQFTGVLKILV